MCFYGDFGSGKTTFFDFLKVKIAQRKIIAIYIQLYGAFDLHSIIISFKSKLFEELAQIYKLKTNHNPIGSELDPEKATKEILSELTRKYETEGFVVFIDELHKGDHDNALKFMNFLQTYKREFIDKLGFINIGFMIAGSLEWEKKISNDPLYSGSVTRAVTMPAVTTEIAYEALNRRLSAFARNPSNPRQITKSFVEKIFKTLIAGGQPLTFRRIIRAVLDEFEVGHFDALTVNPLEIAPAVQSEIKNMLESNQFVLGQIKKLELTRISLEQKSVCLQYLVEVYLSDGIYDMEIKPDQAPYHKKVADAGLIVKTKRSGQLYWVVSSALSFVNQQIMRKFNLSLEDYLLKIYGRSNPRKLPEGQVQEVEVVKEFLSSLIRNTFYQFLELANNLHYEIITSRFLMNSKDEAHKILTKCSSSLANLTRAYLNFEDLSMSSDEDDELLMFWDDFWYSPDEIQEFLRLKSRDETEISKYETLALSIYRDCFPLLFNFIKEQYEKAGQLRIPIKLLSNDEVKELNGIRDSFNEMKYYAAASKTSRLIETKIRSFLFDIFTLLYGDKEHRLNRLDRTMRKYIVDNSQHDNDVGFATATNEFQHLNRGQYKILMTGRNGSVIGRKLWLHIFSDIFITWSETDLDDYLDLFAEINTKVSHNKEESITVEQQNIVYNFILESIEFLKRINGAYLRALSEDHLKVDGTGICFSFCKFKDELDLTRCKIDIKDIERLVDKLNGKELKVPLDQQKFVREYFGTDYRVFMGGLALLANQNDEKLKKTKMKLVINPMTGPNIKIRVQKYVE